MKINHKTSQIKLESQEGSLMKQEEDINKHLKHLQVFIMINNLSILLTIWIICKIPTVIIKLLIHIMPHLTQEIRQIS